jgi:hypothetical protein
MVAVAIAAVSARRPASALATICPTSRHSIPRSE